MDWEFMNDIARQKLNKPPEWEIFHWERLDDCKTDRPDCLVKGGIPRLLTKGSRAGSKKWDGPGDRCAITFAEYEAAVTHFEQTTGRCGRCRGKGQECSGWSAVEGTLTFGAFMASVIPLILASRSPRRCCPQPSPSCRRFRAGDRPARWSCRRCRCCRH